MEGVVADCGIWVQVRLRIRPVWNDLASQLHDTNRARPPPCSVKCDKTTVSNMHRAEPLEAVAAAQQLATAGARLRFEYMA
jgi:hypothetical protein